MDEELSLSFAIHPYQRDVQIMLYHGETNIYAYSAMAVKDISVNGDTLSIAISENESIIITVRPALSIKHQNSQDKT